MKIKKLPPSPKPAPPVRYKLTVSESELEILLAYLRGTAGDPALEPRKTTDAMLQAIYDAGIATQYETPVRGWVRERPIYLTKKELSIYGD